MHMAMWRGDESVDKPRHNVVSGGGGLFKLASQPNRVSKSDEDCFQPGAELLGVVDPWNGVEDFFPLQLILPTKKMSHLLESIYIPNKQVKASAVFLS